MYGAFLFALFGDFFVRREKSHTVIRLLRAVPAGGQVIGNEQRLECAVLIVECVGADIGFGYDTLHPAVAKILPFGNKLNKYGRIRRHRFARRAFKFGCDDNIAVHTADF